MCTCSPAHNNEKENRRQMHDKHVCVNKFKRPAAPQCISPRDEGLLASPNYLSSMDELLDPLLNNFPPVEGFPNLVWRLVDNVPVMQDIR